MTADKPHARERFFRATLSLQDALRLFCISIPETLTDDQILTVANGLAAIASMLERNADDMGFRSLRDIPKDGGAFVQVTTAEELRNMGL